MSALLTDDTCKFVTGGVSITLASRDAQLIPALARAKGCAAIRLPTPTLRLFVSAIQATDLIDGVRATGMISATFSLPATHRTLQFKGKDAKVAAVTKHDRELMAVYVRQFAAAIGHLGFSEEFTRAFFASPEDEVAIEFTPTDGFEQTPGPSAGARLA
jgi:hypothetical protein